MKVEIKNSSAKPIQGIAPSKEYSDFAIKSIQAEENVGKELNMCLGTFEEAPKFLQDNEYIKTGYLLNCNSFKKIFKSFLILHNESVNIWSHLLGAFFFFFLIWYTTIFVTNIKTQINNIRNDSAFIANKAKKLKQESPDVMKNIYKSMKEIENNFKKLDKENIYSKSFNEINYINEELNNQTQLSFQSNQTKIKVNYTYLLKSVYSVKEDIIDLIKLDPALSKENETNLDNNFNLNLNTRKKKQLARWPLYIIIFSAIACLSFSATFHLFGLMNANYFNILNRFDYGGISLLISGSCYPPYYYFFYYSTKFRNFYLILINSFGIGTFLYSLTDDFNKPQRRSLRGILFSIFRLCTGIPILHMEFYGVTIKGHSKDIYLFNCYFGRN